MKFFGRLRNLKDTEKEMAEIECEIKKLERRYEDLKKKIKEILKEKETTYDLEREAIQSKLENLKMELKMIFESLKELFKRMKALMLLNLLNEENEFLKKFDYLKGNLKLDEVEDEMKKEIGKFKLESEEVDEILDMLIVHLGGGKNVLEEKERREEKVGDEVENIPVEETSKRSDEQIHEVEE